MRVCSIALTIGQFEICLYPMRRASYKIGTHVQIMTSNAEGALIGQALELSGHEFVRHFNLRKAVEILHKKKRIFKK